MTVAQDGLWIFSKGSYSKSAKGDYWGYKNKNSLGTTPRGSSLSIAFLSTWCHQYSCFLIDTNGIRIEKIRVRCFTTYRSRICNKNACWIYPRKGKGSTVLGERGRKAKRQGRAYHTRRKKDARGTYWGDGQLQDRSILDVTASLKDKRNRNYREVSEKGCNWICSAHLHAKVRGFLYHITLLRFLKLSHWVLAPTGMQMEKCKVLHWNDTFSMSNFHSQDTDSRGLVTVLLHDASSGHPPLLPGTSTCSCLSDWPALWCTVEDHRHTVMCSIQGLAVTTWKRKNMSASSSHLGTAAWSQVGGKEAKP